MSKPHDWQSATYADVALMNPEGLGRTTPNDLEINYLDIGAVLGPGKVGQTKCFRFSDAPSRARRKVRAGDTIVSTVRPYLRSFAYMAAPPDNTVVSPGFAVLRPRLEKINPEFLYHTVLRDSFAEFLINRQKGSNYPAVSCDDVAGAGLWLPPLGEQRKIAAILSAADELIEQTEAVIEQLQVVKKAMMQELLTRGLPGRHTRFKNTEIGQIPESWELIELDQLIEPGRPICYGILKPGKGFAGGVPVVKVKNIKDGYINESDLLRTSPEIDGQYKRSRLKPGDLLLSIRGTSGRLAIVPPSLKGANITQDTARLSIGDSADSKYVFHCLHGPELQRQIAEQTRGQAVKGINIRDVRRLRIPLPAIEEQCELADLFESHCSYERTVRTQLLALQEGKKALMSVLLTGEVRVTPDEASP